jgi:excinuclease Cho
MVASERRTPRRGPRHTPSTAYTYPEHLRIAIEALPPLPGVYLFHGESDDLPLYIGKSINIRQRVLSHLRTTEEARMLRQARRISHIRTVGEIGALLLEARLIKEQQPLYNQRLRRNRQLCSLQWHGAQPQVVYSKDIDFGAEPGLYGLFSSRHAALDALRQLADRERLCYGVLGLERGQPGKPCFRAMVRQCAGACRGDETPAQHQERLLAALETMRVNCWPFKGAVGLIERASDGPEWQAHVIRNWSYLGSIDGASTEGPSRAQLQAGALQLSRQESGFDADGYKILCRPLLSGVVELRELG